MTQLSTSETLNRAADLIQERGWTRGPAGWGTLSGRGALCLEGGIVAALGWAPAKTQDALLSCPAYRAVSAYLDHPTALWDWNDDYAESASQVVEVLRACAVIEASREREVAEVSS